MGMKDAVQSVENEIEKIVGKETDELVSALSKKGKEETLLVLQFHLYTENMFERIILASIPRGDLLIDNAGLSYHQKLCIVNALDVIEDRYIQSLKKLNKVRNECSHERDKEILLADMELIGRPLGKHFSKLKHEAGDNLKDLSIKTFAAIGAKLIGAIVKLEYTIPKSSS
ncbi:hypothetical protein [Geobacter sulfurreducens]|uniref:hypothetical protein n=1 Tax=Geobacter sulfurreducens TaxID=35554 RepID=UPI0020B63ACC|nr:hypothetical protein [Geobacter sulfurreducens]UTG93450.1 hypothetical protein J8622_03720 [Geobacter sulfurreducens]